MTYQKRDDETELAARRVKQWLDDGMPSWGVPENEIKRLVEVALGSGQVKRK